MGVCLDKATPYTLYISEPSELWTDPLATCSLNFHSYNMARHFAGLTRTLLCSHHRAVSSRICSFKQTAPIWQVRSFTSTSRRQDENSSTGGQQDTLTVNFINRNGSVMTATTKEGESLLEVVIRHRLDIDGFGACEGTLACSTCHVIFDPNVYDQLNTISDEEMDMLDLAYGLTDKSRLGCQVCMTKALDGITVKVPKDISDVRRDTDIVKKDKQ
uniref:2Fe-2S ferredoxin-type domain-containing protein n=1 Tax=Leptobrachium leishanense TaxID=445787 RepID=A0A8C5MIW4_9ANUR